MTRAKKINYAQFDQLGVVIEDSRWKLLYLVVTQFPKRRYSLISIKSVIFFRNFYYRRFFYFIFSVGLTVYLCRARTRLCYNPDVFEIFLYLLTLLA